MSTQHTRTRSLPFSSARATTDDAMTVRSPAKQGGPAHEPLTNIVPLPSHSPSTSSSSLSSSDEDSDATSSAASTPRSTPPASPLPYKRGRTTEKALPAPVRPKLKLDLILSGHAPGTGATPPPPAKEDMAPAAFFPCQRVAFAPKLLLTGAPLRIASNLLPSSSTSSSEPVDETSGEMRLCGMMLSVTGVVEILGAPSRSAKSTERVVKSSRLIADFCTNLTDGIKIWQKDANMVTVRKEQEDTEQPPRKRKRSHRKDYLPVGSYVLPLSMKIPASDQLPPSFESEHFRLRYTMTLALFGCPSATLKEGTRPKVFKLCHIPFVILPATLPSLPPSLPELMYSPPSGIIPSATQLISSVAKYTGVSSLFGSTPPPSPHGQDYFAPKVEQDWYIKTELPTASFSPTGSIPVSLAIKAPVNQPQAVAGLRQQIFVRLTLLRRLYVRESAIPIEKENDWGMGLAGCFPEEMLWERYEKEEKEISQQWGLISLPAGASSSSNSKTIIDNLSMDLAQIYSSQSASSPIGCSTWLDLEPGAGKPSLRHGESSWFSPTVLESAQAHNIKSWDKHYHASSRFFVAIEIGFFPTDQLSSPSNQSTGYVPCTGPSPWAARRPTSASPRLPTFPGKLRELLVPITIGSVAEPTLARFQTLSRPQQDYQGEERGATGDHEDSSSRCPTQGPGEGEPWILPPPNYTEALRTAPAFLYT